MKQPHFLHAETNSQKLKVNQKLLLGIVKNGCGQSGLWNEKLTVTDEIN